ncbi:bifunctional (p)ppGpp synthetase/guanosine-3',5'-bis(diphosphate) 3'-pyrophosphohydrolase [Parafrankia sp. EUN1f]|uniref:RelA/SpoT family protein n=1 Tax=Parafrankia sp. EUN1f TaxID=102897 RepID=UPI0001C4432A|nr:RelA/SpoT family protein [Parafrankia sp. EUN1f]EFC83788.1 (p)ppGpp synthetase I, SpoT/RelA [Parafrankia sp. EUN1f]
MNAEAAGAGLPAGGFSPALSRADGDDGDSRTVIAARQASLRLAHLARRMAAPRTPQVPPELRDLVEAHRDFHPKADIAAVIRAYSVAERLHAGQTRRSGDPYISHPLAVAEVLAELGVDTTTIIAALLHDTVEDTGYSLTAVTAEFSGEVANLVDGVTKLDKMRFGEAAEAETLRKLIVALARDYRVLVIKIADRLHNMRTLGFMSPAKQQKISRVTLEVLAPLAHRLGVSVIKRELEDRAFAVLNPEEHRRISGLVDDFTAAERASGTVSGLVDQLRTALAEARVDGAVSVRISHIFSIFKRAQERGRPPRDYTDIVRVLVLVDDITDCYAALGVIHGVWRPVPGRLRDFVATPKFNMYQSLHTSVTDDSGRTVDIQIRTPSMHRLAETGIVAKPVGPGADGARLEGLSWLHSLLDWQVDTVDPGEFLESLSSDLNSDEVLTFTPKGKMIALPARSSPVDVAYAVHTDVGHRAIGARVNGRLVPLHTRLRNGDVVEILTSNLPGAGPSEDWLDFVRTSRARVRIRKRLARQRRDVHGRSPHGIASGLTWPLGHSGDPARRDGETRPAVGPWIRPDVGAPGVGAPGGTGRITPGPVERPGQAAVTTHGAGSPADATPDAQPVDVGVPQTAPAAAQAALTGQAVPTAAVALGGTTVPTAPSEPTAPAAASHGGASRGARRVRRSVPGKQGERSGDAGGLAGRETAGEVAARGAARRGTQNWAGFAEIEGTDVPVRLARCCLPLPGDKVVGFTTHSSAVSLHRRECANVASSASSREQVTVAGWAAAESQTFPTEIAVEAFDRYGLLADITEVLSDTSASVRAASTSTSEDRVAHARFTIEVTGPEQLDRVLAAVRSVGGVYDCYRACQTIV